MKEVKKILENKHRYAYWYFLSALICFFLPIVVSTNSAFSWIQNTYFDSHHHRGYYSLFFQFKTLFIWFAAIFYFLNFFGSLGNRKKYIECLKKKWSLEAISDYSNYRGYFALSFIAMYFISVYISDANLNSGSSRWAHVTVIIVIIFTLVLKRITATQDLFFEGSTRVNVSIIKEKSRRSLKKRYKKINREIFFYYLETDVCKDNYESLAVNTYIRDNAYCLFKKIK